MYKYIVLSVCILGMLISCTTGRKVNVNLMRQEIIIGQSTKEDVLRVCGQPNSKRGNSKYETWHYAYVKKEVTGLGVIAHVAGVGTETKSDKVIVDIVIEDNIVRDYTIQEGSLKSMHFK